jgi:hypothetical protein
MGTFFTSTPMEEHHDVSLLELISFILLFITLFIQLLQQQKSLHTFGMFMVTSCQQANTTISTIPPRSPELSKLSD